MPKSTQEQEVLIIGDDFIPGAQANSEIDYLLGHNTHMLENLAIRSERFGCSFAPDYCEDGEATRLELERLGVDPLILTTIDKNKKRKAKDALSDPLYFFTASFIFNDEHHITKPFATEELALSCALWYVLAYHS